MSEKYQSKNEIKKNLTSMKKVNKYVAIGFCILTIIMIFYAQLISKPRLSRLKKNYIIDVGFTYSHIWGTWHKNSPPSLKYKYWINGKEYKDDIQIKKIRPSVLGIHFIYKSFPVAIDSTDLSNSKILVTPDDFKEFNLRFPDTLNWVLKYIE